MIIYFFVTNPPLSNAWSPQFGHKQGLQIDIGSSLMSLTCLSSRFALEPVLRYATTFIEMTTALKPITKLTSRSLCLYWSGFRTYHVSQLIVLLVRQTSIGFDVFSPLQSSFLIIGICYAAMFLLHFYVNIVASSE